MFKQEEIKETFRVKMESLSDIVHLADGTSLVDSKDNWYHRVKGGIEKTDFWRTKTFIPFANINIADGFKAIFVKEKEKKEKKAKDPDGNETISVSQIIANAQ